jgi:hypothetical protein
LIANVSFGELTDAPPLKPLMPARVVAAAAL